MSLNEEGRKILVQLQLEKAEKNFSQIEQLRQLGYWDNIANRLYYALFHAVSALLINDGHNISSHRGAVGTFGQLYVLSGVFSVEEGKHYARLQTLREKSDYNCRYEATEEDIAPKIEPTRQLIDKIRRIIDCRSK